MIIYESHKCAEMQRCRICSYCLSWLLCGKFWMCWLHFKNLNLLNLHTVTRRKHCFSCLIFTVLQLYRAVSAVSEMSLRQSVCQMREFSEKKKNGWWGDPVYLKFWGKLTLLEQKRQFSIDIRS